MSATVAAAKASDAILSVDGLTMRFGGLTAVDNLSFEAQRGAITALIGPNGAGKTTVFNCITGFYKPTTGAVTMHLANGASHRLDQLDNHRIASRARVARTFQNIRLFSGMTCLENLLVAQHNSLMRASGFTVTGLLGLPSYARAERAAIETASHWLEVTGLIGRADDAAGELSYGYQRRLEIARALCTGPELLCLDEPAAGLNLRESEALNALLRLIRDQATSHCCSSSTTWAWSWACRMRSSCSTMAARSPRARRATSAIILP